MILRKASARAAAATHLWSSWLLCTAPQRQQQATSAAIARAMTTAPGPKADDAATDVLLYTAWSSRGPYKQLLEQRGMRVFLDEEVEDWSRIGFAVVWKPPIGLLSRERCPNLKAAMSLGAGVDHVLAPGQVPPGVPILRVADPQMAERMATYVVWGVASWQRRFEEYYQAQRARRWDLTIEGAANRDNRDVRVGVLGHGLMGRAAAQALVGLGYRVASWSRSAKPARDGAIECYHGREALREFAVRSDVLVCLLPLTDETRGIVNAELLSWMPRGGALINGARGGHVVEEDLIAALDSGQLTFALLDVFATEPLPEDSPLWLHPRVRITPHVASMTTLEAACDQVAANYRSIMAGQGPLPANTVDMSAGY